jgi:CRP-like cAMP-binding protein
VNILVTDFGAAVRGFFARFRHDPRKAKPVKDPEKVKDLLKKSALFAQLSEENLLEVIGHMESVKRPKGDVIVREGDEGDYYYILTKGLAEVSRKGKDGKREVLANLEAGAVFGEEALISYRKRNASVKMDTDGILLRLSKDAFMDYLQGAMVDWLCPMEAQKVVNSGAQWLDVTHSAKNRRDHLAGAVSMPLDEVRERARKLDKEKQYVCYCENGRRSAAAAFLLRQDGIKASVLRGGMKALSR